MILLIKKFLLLSVLFSQVSIASDWKWAGVEIMGNLNHTNDEILKFSHIKPGENYLENQEEWDQWCSDLKIQLKLFYTHCSANRYSSRQAFLVIDVVEFDQQHRVLFRDQPTKEIPLVNKNIIDLYEKLYTRYWDLFEKGIRFEENVSSGYLDFTDAELHKMSLELAKLVPTYVNNIFEVLQNDKDEIKRAMAANLLNWTIANIDTSIVRANILLDDPSSLVRNNISRFSIPFMNRLKSPKQRQSVIKNLIIQIDRPSFSDRNKAIYGLLNIAILYPSERPFIKEAGFHLIETISQKSILSNVREPALELVALLK